MGNALEKARKLLHRPCDGDRDCPHGRVDVIRGVDGTVGDEIYLVQLSIHAVDGSSGLVDHRENFFFQALDERSKAPNGSAQIEKDEPEPETDDDEEHAERDPDDVEGTQVGERQGQDVSSPRRGDETRADDCVLLVEHSRLPDRDEMLSVAGGWHTHLGILVDKLEGREPEGFWPTHTRLEAEYEKLIP